MAAVSSTSDTKLFTHGLNIEFTVGETALCYEPDPTKAKMLYEAKILEIDVTKDEKGKKVPEFFIHFIGWNKSWDRWVLSENVLKLSEINKALQSKLYNQAVRSKKKRKSRTEKHDSNEDASFDSNSHTSQSSINSGQAENEDSKSLPVVTLNIPHVLKTRLEDDCYYIKRKKKLLKLPRVPTALKILNEFWEYCNENSKLQNDTGNPVHCNVNLQIVKEVVCGLQTYLNFTISTLLLYNFEREQFDALFQSKRPSAKTGITDTPVKKKPDDSVNGERPNDCKTLSPVKRKYTKRKFRTPVYKSKKRNSTSVLAGLAKGTPVSTPNSATPGTEEVPVRRKRGRPRVKRPIEIEDSSGKTKVVVKEAKVETVDSIKTEEHCGKVDESTEQKVDKTEPVKPDSSEPKMAEPEERPPEIKVEKDEEEQAENETEKPEEKSEESGNSARSLRPRRSLLQSRPLDEKEAVREQVSLPIGATAQTMHVPEGAGKTDETSSSAVEKADSQDSCFIPYPLSSEQSLSPAEIYGAEHLLRLFVKLPALLARSDLDKRRRELLTEYLHKFLWFMTERSHLWFSPDNYTESVL